MEQKPPLVLIVDDEAAFREIFSVKLQALGYRTEIAVDGADGVQKAKAMKPDLILMDVQMPNVNGIDALQKIKEDDTLKGTKVLFLTNLGDPQTNAHDVENKFAQEIGAVGYLQKFTDLDVLMQKIQSFLK